MACASLLFTFGSVAIAIILTSQYALAYLRSPFKKLPGPALAQFSDLWRVWNHYSQRHIETQKQLHAKYDGVVRLGPTTVSVTDPNLIKTIYSTRGTFMKKRRPPRWPYHTNIFGTRSNEFHSQQIKPIRALYKQQFATELEPLMKDTLCMLCNRLEQDFIRGANAGQTCDMGQYKDKKNFMNGFLQAKREPPKEVTENDVIGWLIVSITKVAATLFGKYKIELEDPSREWELHKQWFMWLRDIKVKMSLY
ncbi:hypothetical protein K458DRAFT_460392 [Lentithecium fluviatile CBS 122367]|uniref:Cytochrome P450 n=1 Tax=Lentithecium fluviatile CBS 122367 TaxID=1168545 RepID=A0A6G1IP93_9PLEO|nr:hypothetical protein K458DRAFT_460392 [Lentithecium fluviatile CBS 122367]